MFVVFAQASNDPVARRGLIRIGDAGIVIDFVVAIEINQFSDLVSARNQQFAVLEQHAQRLMKSGGDPRKFAEAASELLVPLLGGECLFGLFIVAGLYTLLRPQRGLQDHIVGTQLMPLR